MFDDLDDFFKNNKKRIDDDGNHQHRRKGDDDLPSSDEIARLLEKALGRGVKAQVFTSGSRSSMETVGVVNESKLRDHFEGTFEALIMIGQGSKITPYCEDANGLKLKVGDYLKVPGGKRKKVLELGYGFCSLSYTDEFRKDDGYWFATAIKRLNFIKE